MVNCPVQKSAAVDAVLPLDLSLSIVEAPCGITSPLSFETVSQTLIKSEAAIGLAELKQVPMLPEAAIAAMQTLVELVDKLRSPTSGWQSNTPPCLEDWVAYASEEAYDVLEALLPLDAASVPATAPACLLIDTLVPHLLWRIARTSYPIMQLLEGVRACACLPPQPWMPGILRLVVLLEVKTPTCQGCFDLVTSQAPTALLDRQWWVQPEVDWFATILIESGDRAISPPVADTASHLFSRQAEATLDPSELCPTPLNWAEQQLQPITQAILGCNPALARLQAGIPVEMLAPAADWQSGELRLRFDFEFVPCSLDVLMSKPPSQSLNWVDAELLDEMELEASWFDRAEEHEFLSPSLAAAAPIAVMDVPTDFNISLTEATILRLADACQQMIQTQLAQRQAIAQTLAAFWQQQREQDVPLAHPEALRSLIQSALRLGEPSSRALALNFYLLQPDLLMDEIVPKLLWQLTQSSYEVMQLLGGIAARWLQPGTRWQSGSLRLVALLELAANAESGTIDLAAGRFVDPGLARSPAGAIVQAGGSPFCQTATPADHLLAQVTQRLQATLPEIKSLLAGVAIEHLTLDQDWQPGRLRLHLGLELLPQLF